MERKRARGRKVRQSWGPWERGRLARFTRTALLNTCGRDARAPSQFSEAEIENLRLAARSYGWKFMRRSRFLKSGSVRRDYFNFAYSALASFRMGMSLSASFHNLKKSS